jgi:hypothetical protein
MNAKDYDPNKHQPFNTPNPDPNKALVCFLAFSKELNLTEDDLLFKEPGKEQS